MSPPASADRRAVPIFLVVFVDLISFGIVMPLLPSYGARFESNEALIGLLVAATPAMHLISAPFWGRLSDRVGRRPVMLISLAGAILSYLMFTLAGSFVALLLSRVVAGSIDASVGVGQAYLADRTAPEERAKAMGWIGAAYGLGFIVGPALGGIASLFGPIWPGVLATALAVINLGVAWRILPAGKGASGQVGREAVASTAPVTGSQAERLVPLAVSFLVTLGFTVLYVLLSLFAERDLGYDRSRISGLFVVLGLVTAVVQGWLVGKIAPRMGERTLIVMGALILSVGLGALTGASGAELSPALAAGSVVASLIVTGIGWGLVGPGIAGYISRHTPPEQQGKALGILHGVASSARIVGPPGFGLLASLGSFVPPFCVAAGVAALGAIVAWWAPGGGKS